jgi:hypothetical protein
LVGSWPARNSRLTDDAQWLDQSSAQVLAFVARRLKAESIALVFAEREPGELDSLAGLPELRLEGLSDVHARELLGSVVSGPLDERVAERIVAETRGNPLALLELPHGSSPAELAGGFTVTAALPLPSLIEESFRERVERLPAESQRLLLLAAAEPIGDPALLWRAAERLELGPDAAAPAEAAELLTLGARVTFRHPSCARRPTARRCPKSGGAHIRLWRQRPISRSIPIAARGTAPRPRSYRTKRSLPSSSAQPTAPENAAVSPPQPRFSSDPPR